MQVANEELKYQQAVLQHLGFYKGKIDGIWSQGSIEAKKQFEFKREFSPAIPNNGLPFALTDRLPKGLFFKRIANTMTLRCDKLSDEELNVLLGNVKQTVATREPVVSNDGPLIEAPVEAPVEVLVEAPVEAKTETPVQQRPQGNQHQHGKHQHGHKPNGNRP